MFAQAAKIVRHSGTKATRINSYYTFELRTTMLENFLHLRKSRGQSCEFLGACVTRGQQRRDDVADLFQ